MALRLDSKVAVVTGSSSGIGRSIAIAFASQGAKLVVCADIQPYNTADTVLERAKIDEDSQPTHELICKLHGEGTAVFVRCDVSLGAAEEGTHSDTAMYNGQIRVEKLRGVHTAIEEAVKIGGKLDM